MKTFNTAELDYDRIKENIISYFKTHESGAYSDWDFEGSGLNQLVSILAYNTYLNGINAHAAVNESFLDSAQKRNSVVSRAKILGYIPGSMTAAKATLTLTFPESAAPGGLFELPIGSKFKTVVDDTTYTFITRNEYSALLENGQYTLEGVEVYQGETKTSNFIVDASNLEQKFVIDDDEIDVSTIQVNVYDSATSNSYTSYSLWQTFGNVEITGDSTIYFLSENYDGKYEVRFGNGVFGKKPSSQNIVNISYLRVKGSDANGATVFEWADNDPEPTSITTTSKASNGAEREGIESIRFNAPTTFQAQNRAVTALDYQTLIKSEFKDFDNMAIWGGEDNVPPIYGKAFVCIKPPAAEILSDQQKEDVLDLLSKKKVLAIIPEIVDPVYTYLYFEIVFKYNNTLTSASSGELIGLLRDSITDYNDNILTKFNGVFRHSEFTNILDDTDRAILNSTCRVKAYKKVDLTYGDLIPQTIEFRFECEGEIDQDESFISSDSWTYRDQVLSLADEYVPGQTEYRNIYAFKQDAKGKIVKVFNQLGQIYIESGEITLDPVPVEQNEQINIYVEPRSNDVASKRNNLLSIDISRTKFTPEVDTIDVSGSAGARFYRTPPKNFQ
jgi:hypothetical protein